MVESSRNEGSDRGREVVCDEAKVSARCAFTDVKTVIVRSRTIAEDAIVGTLIGVVESEPASLARMRSVKRRRNNQRCVRPESQRARHQVHDLEQGTSTRFHSKLENTEETMRYLNRITTLEA
jgi:hypothetical protein